MNRGRNQRKFDGKLKYDKGYNEITKDMALNRDY